LQSAIDLIEQGFDVAVVVDAIGSRNQTDKQIALGRMKQEGVKLVSIESILFELCRDAQNPVFKEISNIIK
jgi:nicotinamidase-related amidase